MARLDDLREELEQLGREIEEEVLRNRGVLQYVYAPLTDRPVRLDLDIAPHTRHRLRISISMQLPNDEPP
ncbi:hypothetical protein C9I57_26795 [Trinickia symbiotica]|uniref:Uncharacterized protein n=1 Tax=Trinickia symbiotica TaxID=863227 RepID=A0A2T3XM47_9BURK|nr:hypothetical protein [Trinickia symbiotica]PTB17559.1 hypothetical protein C9I57_26795 [Trinickia symbiotica]